MIYTIELQMIIYYIYYRAPDDHIHILEVLIYFLFAWLLTQTLRQLQQEPVNLVNNNN